MSTKHNIGLASLIFSLVPFYVLGQCGNFGFEAGDFSGWVVSKGYHPQAPNQAGKPYGCCPEIGLPSPGHIIVGGGIESCGGYPKVPPSLPNRPPNSYSAIIGLNSNARAFRLERTFTVTPQNALFVYQYAVAFVNIEHSPGLNPYFEATLLDANGDTIPCSYRKELHVKNDNALTYCSSRDFYYRPWSTVLVGLDSYLGQQVTVRFTSSACALGDHVGYAYVDIPCEPFDLNDTICEGDFTTLMAPDGFVSYYWPHSGETTPRVTVSDSGTYVLTVGMTNGCTADIPYRVEKAPKPSANFTHDNAGCRLDFNFLDSSYIIGGNITGWQWDFGDGSTGNAQNPSHIYASNGFYDVRLIVTSDLGCTDTIVRMEYARDVPIARVSADTACEGRAVQFFDVSTNASDSLVSWFYDFGDGNSSAATNPVHTYARPGTFTVTIRVTASNGCMDSYTLPVTVHPHPVLQFTAPNVCLGRPTVFANSSYVPSPYSVASWYWDFGDLGYDTLRNPAHLYASDGIFTVTMNAVSDFGCADSISGTVEVFPLPQVIIYAADSSGCAPFCVALVDSSSLPKGAIIGWVWDFGNGATSQEQHPEVCYDQPGSYDVSLRVFSNLGCAATGTFLSLLQAYPVPSAGFDASPNPTTIRQTRVTLRDLSTGGTGGLWRFGDNDSAYYTGAGIEHFYPSDEPGEYDARLIIWNQWGCADTASGTIIVLDHTLYVPNAFSPNGDGVNDVFMPIAVGVRDFSLRIFDRWGNLIFDSPDPAAGWKGLTQGRHDLISAPEDVYVWLLKAETIYGNKIERFGHVTLTR